MAQAKTLTNYYLNSEKLQNNLKINRRGGGEAISQNKTRTSQTLRHGTSISSKLSLFTQTSCNVWYKWASEFHSTILIEYDSASLGLLQSVTSLVYQHQHACACCAAEGQ